MYTYRKLTPEQRAALVQERLARGYPTHSPPHPQQEQAHYLLTAACYGHAPYLIKKERREQLLDILLFEFSAAGMDVRAWVILPNHYHLLVAMPEFPALSRIFHQVHGSTARQWNLEDAAAGRRVWHTFADRAIRSERHYYTTLNYLHYNPVKHGWSTSPYEWAETSVHWYVEHQGREWLRDLWTRYPVREYGQGWDEMQG